jgi:hypothetical protein
MSPPAFRRYETPRRQVWIEESWADDLEPLDLSADGGLERWRADAQPVAGGRARGWRIPLPSGRTVHLREMAHGGWLRGITGRRFLGASRATGALEAAAQLRARGATVPAPVAMHAERRGAFFHLAIANQFIENATAGGDFLASGCDPGAAIDNARAAARSIRAFHEAGGSHPDLHVDNLLVRSSGDVVIVDLDGVRVGTPPSSARRKTELARMQRSLRKHDIPEALRREWFEALVAEYGVNHEANT